MARPRKPDALKVIQGTYRPDRANPNAPAPSSDALVAPSRLSKAEKAHFDDLAERLADIDMASATYTEVLSSVIGVLATKLRLTNQSRYTPKAAATAAKASTLTKPWEW